MSTYGSGMWDSEQKSSFEGNLIRDAIGETEQEIFWDALDRAPPDDNNYDDSLEASENIHGDVESDEEQIVDLMGGDDGEPEQVQPQPNYGMPQQRAEPPDMFSDPDGWRRHVVHERAEVQSGERIPQFLVDAIPQRELTYDPNLDRAGMMQDAALLTDMGQQYRAAENTLADELRGAGDEVGADLWQNVKDHIARSVPPHARQHFEQNLVVQRANGTDVVRALVNQYEDALARTEHAQRKGYRLPVGQAVAKPRVNHARVAKGLAYEAPRTREEAIEEDIFSSAWD